MKPLPPLPEGHNNNSYAILYDPFGYFMKRLKDYPFQTAPLTANTLTRIYEQCQEELMDIYKIKNVDLKSFTNDEVNNNE
jgi:hypothetical protein